MAEEKLLEVTIDRARWDVPTNRKVERLFGELVRGTGEDELMCCLGFVGVACGIPKSSMGGIMTPAAMCKTDERVKWPSCLLCIPEGGGYDNSKVCGALMLTNDNCLIDNPTREKDIIRHGLRAGIRFNFVGEYLPKQEEDSL